MVSMQWKIHTTHYACVCVCGCLCTSEIVLFTKFSIGSFYYCQISGNPFFSFDLQKSANTLIVLSKWHESWVMQHFYYPHSRTYSKCYMLHFYLPTKISKEFGKYFTIKWKEKNAMSPSVYVEHGWLYKQFNLILARKVYIFSSSSFT